MIETLSSLASIFALVALVYLYFRIQHKQRGWCLPYQHRWDVRKVVTAPPCGGRGELWSCKNCDKVVAK